METNKFKKKLESELLLVERELGEVARKNPENPNEWEAVETEMDSDHADDNDVADNLESFEDNTGLFNKLDKRYRDIKDALAKIEAGTYGKCEVGGESIPLDRLEANPSAKTCLKHSKR